MFFFLFLDICPIFRNWRDNKWKEKKIIYKKNYQKKKKSYLKKLIINVRKKYIKNNYEYLNNSKEINLDICEDMESSSLFDAVLNKCVDELKVRS